MQTDEARGSLAERQISRAIENGEFDDIEGAGAPLACLEQDYEPGWWARRFVQQEMARVTADNLRSTIRRELPRLRLGSGEPEIARVAELNSLIESANGQLPGSEQIAPVVL